MRCPTLVEVAKCTTIAQNFALSLVMLTLAGVLIYDMAAPLPEIPKSRSIPTGIPVVDLRDVHPTPNSESLNQATGRN